MKKRTLTKRIKYTLLYYFVLFLIWLSNVLPRKSWLAFCGWLGGLAYAFSARPRERTIYHLGLAYGKEKSTQEIIALSKQVFVMLGKNAGDILRSAHVKTLPDLEKFLITEGFENFEKAVAKGKGVIILTSHIGAFDLLGTYFSLRGVVLNIIGAALKDPRLNALLFKHRNAHGSIAYERGKESVRLFKVLMRGGVVAMLIDQDTIVKSRFVNFFGMKAATPIGAVLMALRTGASIVSCNLFLDENGMQHLQILPEVKLIISGDEETDLVVNTQILSDLTEKVVREHPAQWVWMHERWKTKPGEEIR